MFLNQGILESLGSEQGEPQVLGILWGTGDVWVDVKGSFKGVYRGSVVGLYFRGLNNENRVLAHYIAIISRNPQKSIGLVYYTYNKEPPK